MQPFTAQVIEVISSIPEGKVMTYGQIARAAGSPRAARQVVRILHSMTVKYNLPWHRVINAQGEIAVRDDELFFLQKMHLEAEGVIIREDGRIDLAEFQYEPC
ncbi:methylated-DNA-protein-cysteine methyltransferase-like protein [Fontibacillus phaseoli]|uniref:Methylated-DNA-protein-cysteine methyltransferase-like protein n=1 Tax=Fontibacillus phaseoli TaxID=1416533 RepID=A0A369BGP4_9BACL|nr:MGMT family protein [Fontibacillus phaseoli]RCX19736.1 methylated-DNA-protein-cysteine methyltransferase-like protein [Fontibacillus phaseoli]